MLFYHLSFETNIENNFFLIYEIKEKMCNAYALIVVFEGSESGP